MCRQQNFASTLCTMGNILNAFLSSADFFQNQLFRKILSGIPSECQTDWTQIRPDILSGLILVQTVCIWLSALSRQHRLSSGPYFFICSYFSLPFHENALLSLLFTLKCHLRVKIQNFFLAHIARSGFINLLLDSFRERAALHLNFYCLT